MPKHKRWNVDHQPHLIDPIRGERAVMPGESHEFTDEQIEAGLAGQWSEADPREGLAAEKAFKKARDAGAKGAKAADDLKAAAESAQIETTTPAESGETKE